MEQGFPKQKFPFSLSGGLFIIIQLLFVIPVSQAVEIPALTGRVNDYASMISAEAEQEINEKLARLEENESTQVVVLTVESLEGEPLEDFSIRLVEAWKIGQKDFDNGAVLLVAKKDRKLRIEVGYGLEGSLTDLTAGRIVDNDIEPLFKQGQFDQGFVRGVDMIIAAVQGEYSASQRDGGGGSLLPVLIILVLIIYFYSQVPRGGEGGGSGPLIFTGGPGNGGFYGGRSSGGSFGGGFSGGGGSFGGGGASGSW